MRLLGLRSLRGVLWLAKTLESERQSDWSEHRIRYEAMLRLPKCSYCGTTGLGVSKELGWTDRRKERAHVKRTRSVLALMRVAHTSRASSQLPPASSHAASPFCYIPLTTSLLKS